MSFEAVPLPGTHLAEVDCIDCGAMVLAVPEYADRARCAACGREHNGATGEPERRATTIE